VSALVGIFSVSPTRWPLAWLILDCHHFISAVETCQDPSGYLVVTAVGTRSIRLSVFDATQIAFGFGFVQQ